MATSLREPYEPDLPDEPPELEPGDEPRLELQGGVVRCDLAGRTLRALDLCDVRVEGGDWSNVRAPRASWLRASFHGLRLTGAELAEATLRDVAFADCRLDLVALRASRLERVVFADCGLEELDLYGARLEDVRFERCRLHEATFSAAAFERCELRGCDLTGLRGADRLAGVRMTWDDVLQNAPLFAAALGVELVEP